MTTGLEIDDNAFAATAELFNGALMKHLGLQPEMLKVGLLVGRNHMQRGDYAEAFSTYRTLVLCNPSDVDLQVAFANCCLVVGHPELALQSAAISIGVAPEDPRGYLLSARASAALKAMPEAVSDAKLALDCAERVGHDEAAAEARRLIAAFSQVGNDAIDA